MSICKPMRVLSSAILAALPALAFARGLIEDLPGVADGPRLSSYSENLAVQGYAGRSARIDPKADQGSVSFIVETPDGRYMRLRMDPISGEIKY